MRSLTLLSHRGTSRALWRWIVLMVAPLAFASPSAAEKTATLRLLFVGNSLTAYNDLPALVQALAAHQGRKVEVTVRTAPDHALDDHWKAGAGKRLTSSRFDYVILQQGPSTRPESREHLRTWTLVWAEAARAASTRVALFMVWPVAGQRDGFALVARSYREAAEASGSRLLAAGDAWAAVLGGPEPPALHASDGLHPTLAGSFLAAMVIARDLTGIDPANVPNKVRLASGRSVQLPEATVDRFRKVLAGK